MAEIRGENLHETVQKLLDEKEDAASAILTQLKTLAEQVKIDAEKAQEELDRVKALAAKERETLRKFKTKEDKSRC